MSDYGNIGKGFIDAAKCLVMAFIVTSILAVWKLIDIAIWIFKHITIAVN